MGRPLWNFFFQNASVPIIISQFTEIIFADDLNASRAYDNDVANEAIRGDIDGYQFNLHRWCETNQVTFDPAKESMHIGSLTGPEGDNFRIHGARFDAKLTMTDCIDEYRITFR